MTHLVTEMSEQRAVRFLEIFANSFANRSVPFLDVHRDEPVVVTRQYPRSVFGAPQKIERQSLLWIFFLRLNGYFHREQRRNHPPLCLFESSPQNSVFRHRQIR